MDVAKYIDEISELPLLNGIEPTDLKWLLHHSQVKSLQEQQVLLSPEQDNDTVYILLSGRLEVRFDQGNGEIRTYLESGDWVGEISVIDKARPSATVIADAEVRLLAINGDIMWELIERSHVAARNLLHALSSRVRRDNELLAKGMQQQRLFSEKAQTDFLTGLRNRYWLDESLSQILAQQKNYTISTSVMMMDIDHFKKFNDRHGHLAGDMVLQAVSQVVRDNLRKQDAAIRYGGEELMIVMLNTEQQDAEQIAKRLCRLIRELKVIFHDGSVLPPITVSIGVYTIQSDDSVEQLLGKVDSALYQAKNSGRDQVVVWSEKMPAQRKEVHSSC